MRYTSAQVHVLLCLTDVIDDELNDWRHITNQCFVVWILVMVLSYFTEIRPLFITPLPQCSVGLNGRYHAPGKSIQPWNIFPEAYEAVNVRALYASGHT